MSHDDLKSSAHVWGDGDGVMEGEDSNSTSARQPSPPSRPEPTPSDAPPAYSSAADHPAPAPVPAPSSSQPRNPSNPLSDLSRLATIPFHQYQIPVSTFSPDRAIQTTTHPPFQTRPESLAALLIQQADLPPKPSLRITGTHKTSSGETKTDFDLTLSLLPLLSLQPTTPSRLRLQPPPSTPSPSKLFKSSASQHQPTPLQAWTRHFCITDKSEHRSLTLTRTIADLDAVASALEGSVRTLLANLKYRGKLDVSFPVEHANLVVLKPPGNWLVGLLRIYPEKKFEVAEARWELGDSGSSDGSAGVAERWWRVWEGPVKNAVLARTRGRVGVEEWIAWSMGAAEAERRVEWGVDWAYESSL